MPDVTMPNGFVVQGVPDGMTQAQLLSKLQANGYNTDTLLKPNNPAGFFGSLYESAVNPIKETAAATAFATDRSDANRKALLDAANSGYSHTGWGEGNNWEAFKENAGSLVGGLAEPLVAGAVTRSAYGAGAALFHQHLTSNLVQQAQQEEAQAQKSQPIQHGSFTNAMVGAAVNTGLDMVAAKVFSGVASKVPFLNKALNGETGNIFNDAAAKQDASYAGSIARNVAKGTVYTVPQQVAESAVNRWQAGQDLGSPEAIAEYKQAAISGLVGGGLFGAYEGHIEHNAPYQIPQDAIVKSREALSGVAADPTNMPARAAAVETYKGMGIPEQIAAQIVENHANRVLAIQNSAEGNGGGGAAPGNIPEPTVAGRYGVQNVAPTDPTAYLADEHARLTGLLSNPANLTSYAADLGEHPALVAAATRERLENISNRLGVEVPDAAKAPPGAPDVLHLYRQLEAQKNMRDSLVQAQNDPNYIADRVSGGEHPDQVADELSSHVDTANLTVDNLKRELNQALEATPLTAAPVEPNVPNVPTLPFPDQAAGEAPSVKYMAGRRAKDTVTGSLFGEDEAPAAGQGALDKREQYQQQLLANTREERAAAQEQASQQAGEIGQARDAKAEQDTRDTLDDLEFALREQHPDNANYQIVYNKDQTFPFKLMGSDGVLRFESRTLDDFQNQVYEGMKPDADEPLTPYTDTPSGARTENTPSPYNEEVQSLVNDITANVGKTITPNDRAQLLDMLTPDAAISGNRTGTYKGLEQKYREAESAFRNAGSAGERRVAQDALAQAGENLRNATRSRITDPIRARLQEIIENRQDEQAGAKQRIGNAKVQERLGQMEGERTAPETREQREAAIDLKEATPQKYRAGEKEAGGPPKLVSTDEVQKMVDDITKGWKSDAKVNVVQSEADLPPEIQRAIERDNAHGALGLVGPDGTVHLIADNMHSIEDGKAALFHETLGHLGLEKLFRGNLDSALEAMYRGNKKLRDETNAWREKYPDAYKDDPNPLARAVEEVLAGRSEVGKIDTSLFQRVAAIVKNFARRMGFKGDMADGEVNAILSMAHDRMVSGEKESTVVKGLRYMTAWHGSPHDFDRFSTEHMGTGEGAQAYGWGLYFADRKAIAENYRNILTKATTHVNDAPYEAWAKENLPKGKFNQNAVKRAGKYLGLDLRTKDNVTKSDMLSWVDSIKLRINELQTSLETGFDATPGWEGHSITPEVAEYFRNELKDQQAILPVMEELSKHDITRKGGKLYQVDITPDDDKFLSWDKPLHDQSDHVKDALRSIGVDPEAERNTKYPATGADLYAQLRRRLGGQEATSKALLAAGIEGNKYLDASSRGPSNENPSHNYVVFNDNNVNITNKYMRPEVPPEVADRLESNAGDISEGLKRATNSFDTQEAATGLGTAIRAHASDGVIAGLQSYGDALHAELLEKMLSAFPTSGIVGWKGEEIPGLVDIENKLADMDNMKHNLLKYSDTLARDIDSFVRKNGTKALSKAQVTMRINEVTPEDFVGATTVQEVVMRDKMVNYVLDKINNFDPKGGVTLDQYITARDKRVDAVRDGFNTWQELNKSAGGQQLYMRMRDYFKDMYDASTALLDKRIQQFPDKAAASKLLAEVRRSMELDRGDKLSEAQKANDPYWMLPQGLLPKDYFPFLRSGKFWLRVAENAKAGRERQFYTFNSAIERDAALKNIAKRMGVGPKDSRYLTTGNNVDTLQDNIRGESELLGRIFDTLDKAKDDTPSGMVNLRDLTDSIYQVYLMSMPERSIRRQFIHADEVTGMSMDVLKNFAAKATYYANNLSKMAFADDIHNTVKGAYENNRDDKSKPNDKIASDETFIREMATRAENALKPQRMDSVLNTLNRVSFVYFLSSAKSILPHLLDVPRRMVPALGGEFGYTKALPKFAKYMDLSESLGALHTSDDGSVHVVAPNIGDSILVKSNPLLARAFEALNDRNVFGGMAANLIQNERASPKGSRGTIGRAIDATSFAMTSAFRYGEMLSRQTASMMAFELQHERLMEAEKPTSSAAREDIFNRAVDYAVQATKRNMGNYAGYERPTLLQKSALRRMVGAYKLWSIKQVAFLVGTANRLAQAHLSNEINDLKNQRGSTTGQALTALETQIANLQQQRGARRAAAAKEFAGVMMMTGMLSGVRGLPLIGLIATTLSALNNNPEDEAKRRSVDPLHADNPLVWFHNEFLPQHFGNPTLTTPDGAKHPLNNLIMDGALNELSGYDLGEAASMSSLFFKDSAQENNTRGSLVNEAISNIVPLAMVNNISTMVDHFAKGEIERGLEVGAPKGISDQLKANRYATEGIQNDNKIEMAKSEFNNADIIATALGIQPTRVKRLEDYLREDRQNLKAANTQRQALLHSYAKVYYEGGSEKQFNDAATAIAKFNQKYPVPSLTIDGRSIRSSVKDYYKNVENSYRGVTINKKNAGYEIPGIESVSPQAPSQDTDDSGQ